MISNYFQIAIQQNNATLHEEYTQKLEESDFIQSENLRRVREESEREIKETRNTVQVDKHLLRQ